MTTIFACLITAVIVWKVARKYQDFSDLMLARRIAKMVEQRDRVTKDIDDFARWERQDKRLAKKMRKMEDDEEEEQ